MLILSSRCGPPFYVVDFGRLGKALVGGQGLSAIVMNNATTVKRTEVLAKKCIGRDDKIWVQVWIWQCSDPASNMVFGHLS